MASNNQTNLTFYVAVNLWQILHDLYKKYKKDTIQIRSSLCNADRNLETSRRYVYLSVNKHFMNDKFRKSLIHSNIHQYWDSPEYLALYANSIDPSTGKVYFSFLRFRSAWLYTSLRTLHWTLSIYTCPGDCKKKEPKNDNFLFPVLYVTDQSQELLWNRM